MQLQDGPGGLGSAGVARTFWKPTFPNLPSNLDTAKLKDLGRQVFKTMGNGAAKLKQHQKSEIKLVESGAPSRARK